MPPPRISLVIPAHNEAAFLPACLAAARAAEARLAGGLEIVVVLNRCTDATEAIARDAGERTIRRCGY